jgi:hypothetical protein
VKLVLKVALIGAAALVLLGVALVLALDPLVTAAVEKGASYATGTPASVRSIDVGLFSGKLDLAGLSIGNPPGFRDEPFLELGSAKVEVQAASLFGEAIQVDLIALDGVTLNLERKGGKTNHGAILEHLEQISGAGKPEEPPADEPEAPGEARTLRVTRVVVTDVTASLHLDVPLVAGSGTVHVPRFEIEDFVSDGSTTEIVAKLVSALVQAILQSVVTAGGDVLPGDLLRDLRGQLGALGEGLDVEAGKVLDGAKETLGGLKGLFGGKKK